MTEPSIAQKRRERYRLEDALGYSLRIAEKIQDKKITSLEELTKLVEEDFKGISASLSFHCRDDLKNAGFAIGLFDDSLKEHEPEHQSTAPTLNDEKQEESERARESINVNFPKAFLQNVVGYMKKTGHYNDLDEFVMEALRERMLKVS